MPDFAIGSRPMVCRKNQKIPAIQTPSVYCSEMAGNRDEQELSP
ncbi:hypothetical protein [Luteibacter yeojuensis]|nr:hypothetical protein [Luteibacter yeojuensis]